MKMLNYILTAAAIVFVILTVLSAFGKAVPIVFN